MNTTSPEISNMPKKCGKKKGTYCRNSIMVTNMYKEKKIYSPVGYLIKRKHSKKNGLVICIPLGTVSNYQFGT
jgi:hypothetical protein